MEKRNPKIAIMMSCYNHEKFVREAMESVIGQTYTNWELYVVNDGSVDKTGEILESFQDERIHYQSFEKNTMLVGAFNYIHGCMQKAEADYIAGIASDDMWEKDKLEKQVNFLCEHPEYKACFTWDKVIFSSPDKGYYENGTSYSHRRNRNRYEWISRFFWKGNCLNGCSMLLDKQVFYELDGMNQVYRQLADYRLWLKLVTKYPFYLLEEELTYYRRHETNLSNATVEVVTRDCNENYQIIKETLLPMDKKTFRRSFYMHLPYVKCDTEEELLAEKFFILLSERNNLYYKGIKEQAALDIYYAHNRNNDFISVLEEKYFFAVGDFMDLSGSGGLQAIGTKAELRMVTALVLTNAIDCGRIDKENIENYGYSTLYDLWDLTYRNEGGGRQFERIKQFIIHMQGERKKKRKENRVLFMIAQSSEHDFSQIVQEKCVKGTECYAAFIPSIKEGMKGNYKDHFWEDQVEGAETIKLYNEREHSLYFMYELSREIDCIYYIDCIDDSYECNHMAAGYSLAVEQHCILSREKYQNMLHSDPKVLAVMNSIEIYDN